MSKILVVFGATGQQGGSVVQSVLTDPELSKEFKIRAITRDVTSAKAQQLKEKGTEVVAGDVTDRTSIEHALTGAHTVFLVTTPSFTADGFEVEYNTAKMAADVAVGKGVKYFIFSTLPSVKEVSKGKYTKAIHFEAKAAAEKYIRSLPIKSAFVVLGAYMENYVSLGPFVPRKTSDDTYAISLPQPGTTRLPHISATEDTGKFVGAILAAPEKFEGKTFAASEASYSMDEIAAALSKSAGKKVIYKEVDMEPFAAQLPPIMNEAFPDVLCAVAEFSYYGPNESEDMAWSGKNARGKLHSLDEYLRAHPLQLQ